MLRRVIRAVLDSAVFERLTQSSLGWSIVRLAPRSFRQRFRDVCHSLLYAPQTLPIYESRNEPWDHNTPLLSVIVLCYNYGKYIRQALQSIRAQTLQDYELLIIDDGSTDPLTIDVLNNLRDEGVRIQTQEHGGPARAINFGISLARGKYVCCLSADDTIDPTYAEECVVLLESNLGLSFAYSLVQTFGSEQRIGVTEPFDLRLLLKYNHVCGSAVFLRDSWKSVGGFDESMSAYEDWDFWIRLGKAGLRGKLIPEPLFHWRRHPETFGIRVDKKRPALLAKIRTNHSDLFTDPGIIDIIQKNYRDCHVSNPFINLASAEQYAQPSGLAVLIISDTSDVTRKMIDFLAKLRSKEVCLISAITGVGSLAGEIRSVSDVNYNLTRFLEPYHWRDFIINLITTRSIHTVLICNSKLGYELSQIIRAYSSATIMDALELEESKNLSLQFNAYLDYHITFSDEGSTLFSNASEDFRMKMIPSTKAERDLQSVSRRQ